MSNGFIVSGTDTGIGKTVFCAGLVGAVKGSYWKPIQAGLDGETDRDVVGRLSGITGSRLLAEAYRLETPCSPHRAGELDGVTIEPKRLELPDQSGGALGPLVVEGAGGLMVPLTRTHLQIDQFAVWGLPVILCARTTLGTINHSLLSIEALRKRGLMIAGIAFIGPRNDDTQETIREVSGVRVLGRLPIIEQIDARSLANAFGEAFQIQDFVSPS